MSALQKVFLRRKGVAFNMEKKQQLKIFLIVFAFVSLGYIGLLPIKITKVDNTRKKRRLTVTLIAKKVKLPEGSGFGFGYGKGPILKPGGIPDPRLIKQHRKITPPKEEKKLKTIPKKPKLNENEKKKIN